MNLVWTNLEQTLAAKGHVLPVLVPGLPQHCDFFRVQNRRPDLLDLRTEVTPNEVGLGVWPTKKPRGRYRADIAVSAENADTIRRTLEIEFSGTWSPDLDQMAKHEARVALRRA